MWIVFAIWLAALSNSLSFNGLKGCFKMRVISDGFLGHFFERRPAWWKPTIFCLYFRLNYPIDQKGLLADRIRISLTWKLGSEIWFYSIVLRGRKRLVSHFGLERCLIWSASRRRSSSSIFSSQAIWKPLRATCWRIWTNPLDTCEYFED